MGNNQKIISGAMVAGGFETAKHPKKHLFSSIVAGSILKYSAFGLFLMAFQFLSVFNANGQIVTPYLDRNLDLVSPAANGWRDASAVSVRIGSAGGKAKIRDFSGKMVEAGDTYHGKEVDYPSSQAPYVLLAYKGERFGVELFTNLGDGSFYQIKGEAQVTETIYGKLDLITGSKKTKLYTSYLVNENVSIGIGYNITDNTSVLTPTINGTELFVSESKKLEAGPAADVSMKLAEVFYLAIGMRSITGSGSVEKTDSTTGSITKKDTVEASWIAPSAGLGLLVGEPGETRFRAEVSMITAPEKSVAAEGDKAKYIHRKTKAVFASVEIQFGPLVLGMRQTQLEKSPTDLDPSKDKNKTTFTGIGWHPEEGVSLSLSAMTVDKRIEKEFQGIPIVIDASYGGGLITVGYTF
jgi:hypothetical protein